MDRLTFKVKDKYFSNRYPLQVSEDGKSICIDATNKLGRIEDILNEFNIETPEELETLLRVLNRCSLTFYLKHMLFNMFSEESKIFEKVFGGTEDEMV